MLVYDVHDKIVVLIGTWRTTRENSATTRVVCDAHGWLIRKASGEISYPKEARAVEELPVYGGSRVDHAAMAFRTRDSYTALLRNRSGFSEASGTL
jgi:nitrite reductase/ring-hydroxylating ferredoxin subunit